MMFVGLLLHPMKKQVAAVPCCKYLRQAPEASLQCFVALLRNRNVNCPSETRVMQGKFLHHFSFQSSC